MLSLEPDECMKWIYDQRHPDYYSDRVKHLRDARDAALRSAPEWMIREAYALAALRTKLTGIKWHVDHIIPLRNSMVCGLHCEKNLQVIPARDNISKGNRFSPWI